MYDKRGTDQTCLDNCEPRSVILMSNPLPTLEQLQEELRQGHAEIVLAAIDRLTVGTPPTDQLLRLKIAALEMLGHDADALRSELHKLLEIDEPLPARVDQLIADYLVEKLRAHGRSPTPLRILASDGFFCLALAKIEMAWPHLELLLTALRQRILLESCGSGDATATVMALIHSMAVQCHRNEYAWYLSADEEACLEAVEQRLRLPQAAEDSGVAPATGLLGLLLMYRSPPDLERAGLINRDQLDGQRDALQDFVVTTLDSYARETRLAAVFASQYQLGDETSSRVAGMYEENPYPRWTSKLPMLNPHGRPLEEVFELVQSPAWQSRPTRPVQSILVAGCGTGRSPLAIAVAFPRTRVVAIDISCRSLAYAGIMAERYRVTNVEFQRRDILGLAGWGEQFDLVESVGVIHHMRDPAAGLRGLLKCLRPGGLLRLGVYSRSGRDPIIRFRERQTQVRSDRRALREMRHGIFEAGANGPYRDVLRFRDFYTLSGCRDLLRHEQETQFSIPELQALLKASGLTFLRFETQPGMTEALRDLPDPDTNPFELAHWHQAELRSPSLFAGMYILYARFDGTPA